MNATRFPDLPRYDPMGRSGDGATPVPDYLKTRGQRSMNRVPYSTIFGGPTRGTGGGLMQSQPETYTGVETTPPASGYTPSPGMTGAVPSPAGGTAAYPQPYTNSWNWNPFGNPTLQPFPLDRMAERDAMMPQNPAGLLPRNYGGSMGRRPLIPSENKNWWQNPLAWAPSLGSMEGGQWQQSQSAWWPTTPGGVLDTNFKDANGMNIVDNLRSVGWLPQVGHDRRPSHHAPPTGGGGFTPPWWSSPFATAPATPVRPPYRP